MPYLYAAMAPTSRDTRHGSSSLGPLPPPPQPQPKATPPERVGVGAGDGRGHEKRHVAIESKRSSPGR